MWRLFKSYWLRDVWYTQISSRIWPRSKWLTKKIPRTWVDKDTILEITVIECLKHFVETDGEDAFNILATDNPPEQARFMLEVKYYYDLATQKLPSLEKEMEAEWEKVPKFSFKDLQTRVIDYDKTYGRIDELEQQIYDLQTEIMVWIVQNRNGLWT